MKVEELMIGDWVNLYGSPIKINIDDLGVIERDEIYDKGVHCKPIPLTPEILESNNFQSKEDPYSHRKFFFLGKNEYNLDVYFDNGTIILVDVNDEPTVYAYVCDCKYVHNLQHILKDLKIEKEIAL